MDVTLLYLFIATGLARLINLNQSLWLDEATTANVVKNLNAEQIITQYTPTDFHPPFYYLFMDAWTSIFGYSEIALRMPSVLFSLIAGYFVYLTGKQMGGKKMGFWAAVFFLINPLVLYYSQEARMYMMITCLVSMSIYYLFKILGEKKYIWKDVIILNVVLGLCFATFYGSIFFVVAVFLLLILKKKWRLFVALLPGPMILFAFVAPLLMKQLQNSKVALQEVKNWKAVLGKPNLKNVLLIPIKFTIGRISFFPKIVYYAYAAVSVLGVWFFIVKGAMKQRMLWFLFLVPLAGGFLFSFNQPLLQYFRFLFLMPLVALLLAYGTRIFVWERALVSTIFGIASLLYLFTPSFHREDWKHILLNVPKATPVYMIPTASDPIQYYYADRKIESLLAVQTATPAAKEIVVLPYAADIHGFPYAQLLTNGGYKKSEEVDFRGVLLEYWQK